MKKRIRKFRWQRLRGELNIGSAEASLASWLGHAQHANSQQIRTKIVAAYREVISYEAVID